MILKIPYIAYKWLKVTKNDAFSKISYFFPIFLNIDISHIKIGVFGVAKL